MCSSAVKTDAVQIAFATVALILAAALQDMLPAFGGAKTPLLQMFALYVAFRWPGRREARDSAGGNIPHAWIWTAVAAGYMLEALSGLPWGCCIAFMLPACAVARAIRHVVADMSPVLLGMTSAILFAPLHEAWLEAWGATGGGSAFVRFFASALPAAAAGAVIFWILPAVEHFAGLGEEAGS